ncbi:hypothetical protein GF366_01230 [Candidatus Peregrinibacteria bacterium]|nr:hypothetical protein [Candidatus Peregrinibacteria bacterium]
MKIRKILVPFLTGAMLFSFMGSNFSANADFTDVPEYNLNFPAVSFLENEGIVVGYGDGRYGVDKNINRAEFLKIVMEASDYEVEGGNCFPDVRDQWFAPYVCTAYDLGLVDGYPDGTFKPGREINFAEASKIVVNTLDVEKAEGAVGTWFEPFVTALENEEAIPGRIDSFDEKLTRGDMAEMTWRIMENRTYKISNTYENIAEGKSVSEFGSQLVSFESCGELKGYMEDNYEYHYYYDGIKAGEPIAMEEPADALRTESTEGLGAGAEAEEYSTTNIQVEGVDEADIVKNDGKYIYYLKDNTVRIVEAYPPEQMKELDDIEFGNPNFIPFEMYADENRLVVLGESYGETFSEYSGEGGIRYDYYGNAAMAYIFDISDRSNVELIREVAFEGYYFTSRKINDVVYLVANRHNYFHPFEGDNWNESDLVPLYSDNGDTVVASACGGVKYIPGVNESIDYMVLAAIPIDDMEKDITREVVLGSVGEVYASTQNLYMAEPKYKYDIWYQESENREETFVHKFALDSLNLGYEGVGTVPGTVLNQFSMDEDNGYFRIATTTGGWYGDPMNNLYVLNDNLELVGSVEGLAVGERIYSVRFVGDRAYMVTFERIDPLFVIDLSTPSDPKVLGELKISGVSDYLHPYDENHIIGFGLESLSIDEVEEFGWSWFQGIKMSMFDVTDVNNPEELHKVVIGDRGTSSELSYNHKALLFDKEKGIMGFPITVAEIPQNVKDDLDIEEWVYGDYVFQGAYVYDVSVEDGFVLRGTISHYEEDELGSDFEYYYNYGADKNIKRIIYIGNDFYTVSDEMVKANNMDTMNESASVLLGD